MRRRPHGLTAEDRFWAKVEIGATDGCWIWVGARNRHGYGHFGLAPKKYALAHRVAYEWLIGPIPDGLEIDHLCRVRACVNPSHLEAVTRAENMRRSYWATRTHCRHGHELSGDNMVMENGYRRCRACKREADRKRWARRAA